jgi:hypothetical protein
MQPRGAQTRVLCERVANQRQEGIELTRAIERLPRGLRRNSETHGVVMHVQRLGNRADLPVFRKMEPSNLRAQVRGKTASASARTRLKQRHLARCCQQPVANSVPDTQPITPKQRQVAAVVRFRCSGSSARLDRSRRVVR